MRPRHPADFGQTLGVWGVGPGPSGPFPLFGPCNECVGGGIAVALFTNPTNFITGGAAATISTASGGAGFIDGRAGLGGTKVPLGHESLDLFAACRMPEG